MTGEITIGIENPQTLVGKKITGERVPVGTPGDYKPCVARLPRGELLITAFFPVQLEKGQAREEMYLFRSADGGLTWSPHENLTVDCGILGREPYLTVLRDGTALVTVHFLSQDLRNTAGYTQSYVYRSADAGRTWMATRTELDGVRVPGGMTCTSRNVLELHDGSLMLGASGAGPEEAYVWRSYDGGATWAEKYRSRIEQLDPDYPWPWFGEAVWWQAPSGKIYLIDRLDSRFVGELVDEQPQVEVYADHYDRMILYETSDEGRTFRPVRTFGVIGQMYPSVLKLNDGRLLLTFTVRAVHEPLGVRAIVGEELDDDMRFDFEHDQILLDTQTPAGVQSGGGFGRTDQLADGTLVTSYSWRDTEQVTHLEVLRWHLP